MAENKNFVERSVQDGETPHPAYETLKFKDTRHPDGGRGDWFSHILLGYVPTDLFDQLCKTPGFNNQEMKVSITINGIQVIHAEFEAMISEFSGRMLAERMQRGDWHNFEKAVETKAEAMLKVISGDFMEKAHTIHSMLTQFADQSETMLQTIYNQPYKWQITSEMKDAGAQAVEDFGDYNDTPINRRVLADKVYSAMVKLKPEGSGKNVKLKLPPVIPVPTNHDFVVDKREVRGRKQMFEEMKTALAAIGIDIDQLAAKE